jgi:hypothetical protein
MWLGRRRRGDSVDLDFVRRVSPKLSEVLTAKNNRCANEEKKAADLVKRVECCKNKKRQRVLTTKKEAG